MNQPRIILATYTDTVNARPKPERSGPKPAKAIPKVSAKRAANHGTGEYDLMVEIAAERPHMCFVTRRAVNVWIPVWGRKPGDIKGSQIDVRLFAHVISKGARPDLRLLPENIVILSPEMHRIYDKGSPQERKDAEKYEGWQLLKELKEKILSEHQSEKVVRV